MVLYFTDHIRLKSTAGLRFQPDYGKVLSASYRYTRNALTGKPSVDQIDIEKNKVRVIVSMFGRETPVELELDQVELVND